MVGGERVWMIFALAGGSSRERESSLLIDDRAFGGELLVGAAIRRAVCAVLRGGPGRG